MSTIHINLVVVALVAGALMAPTVRAEEAHVIEIAATGLYLPNHAVSQDKHYLEQDGDLLGRIACLMQDVDVLLGELHALPPELGDHPVVVEQPVDELAGLIALALNNNPELKPFHSRLAVQAAKTRQAGAKPDPMLMFNIANLPLPQLELEDTPMTQFVFGWSQQYVSYGKRGLRRDIASLNEDIIVLDLTQHELEIIGDLTGLYYGLASTKARLDVLGDNAVLLELLIELAERKYALGRTPQAQVIEAQTMLTGIEEQRIKLENLLGSQREMINELLGRPAGYDLEGIVGEFSYPLPIEVKLDSTDLLSRALAARPDNQRYDLLAEQQELEIELKHRAYRPDYTVSASYGYRQGKRDFLSAGISFPLYTHKSERQDAALQEAYAALDVIEAERGTLENQLATRIALIELELDRIVELSNLYRTGLVPQARLALDSSIAGYAANQVDLAGLLRAQQNLLSYELELERLYIEYQAVLNELQIVTAGEFDPWPYLVLQARPVVGDTVAVPLEVYDQVSAEELSQLHGLLTDVASTTGAALKVPAIDDGFIDKLMLPEVGIAPEDDTAGGEGIGESDTEEPGGDTGFYAPYQPAKETDDDD